MKEFIVNALPWIVTAVCIAVLAVQVGRRRRKNGEKKEKTENYGAEGMCLGMCLGTALGSSFGINMGIGLSMGMMLGLLLGSCIGKADGDKENEKKD